MYMFLQEPEQCACACWFLYILPENSAATPVIVMHNPYISMNIVLLVDVGSNRDLFSLLLRQSAPVMVVGWSTNSGRWCWTQQQVNRCSGRGRSWRSVRWCDWCRRRCRGCGADCWSNKSLSLLPSSMFPPNLLCILLGTLWAWLAL